MMKAKKHGQKSRTGSVLLGTGICLFSFLFTVLIFSLIARFTKDPLSFSSTYSPLAFAAGGLLAGWIGKRMLGQGRLFLFCPPIFLLTVLLIGLLLSGGRLSPSALLSEAILLACSYFAFFVFGRKPKARRRRH